MYYNKFVNKLILDGFDYSIISLLTNLLFFTFRSIVNFTFQRNRK
jgi:hypothetical protein